jgi:hypothetical protein
MRIGVSRPQAIRHGKSRKGYWRMAKTIASGVGMTNKWQQEQGQVSLVGPVPTGRDRTVCIRPVGTGPTIADLPAHPPATTESRVPSGRDHVSRQHRVGRHSPAQHDSFLKTVSSEPAPVPRRPGTLSFSARSYRDLATCETT